MNFDVNGELASAASIDAMVGVAASTELGAEMQGEAEVHACAEEISKRRQRFRSEPMTALDSGMSGRRILTENRQEWIDRWDGFEKWCAARELLSLPASEETLVRFVRDLVHPFPGRQQEGNAVVPLVEIRRSLSVIRRVHRYLGYNDPSMQGWAYLKSRRSSGWSLPLAAGEQFQAYLAAPADGLVDKRTRCIVALIYHLHLKASAVAALKLEDYQRGSPECLPTLRLQSNIGHQPEYWQPLPRALAHIVDTWIEAVGVRNGYLICDTRRNKLGTALCAQYMVNMLRTVGPGRPFGMVRALHRQLFSDVFNGTNIDLTGMEPSFQRGDRIIRFGPSHSKRTGRIVRESP